LGNYPVSLSFATALYAWNIPVDKKANINIYLELYPY
jgi:hypothetical protein